jgi:hypothetical protein
MLLRANAAAVYHSDIPAQRCMGLLPAPTKLLLLLRHPARLTNCMLHRSMLLTLTDRARGLLTGATTFLQ